MAPRPAAGLAMARLALDQAPTVSLPRRFLVAMPAWGAIAGVLLLTNGDAALRSRWHPATLAAVHCCTLGVLGNAMFGSLLQFLPAAAGVRLRLIRLGPWMHGLLNVGTLLLVAGLQWELAMLLPFAALLLIFAFALLMAMTLPGICGAVGQRLLRAGIGTALAFGGATALLGVALALGASGYCAMVLPPWVDVHASLGVLGWVVLLLASVGRVVMPMFQGTVVPAAWWQAAWSVALMAGLLLSLAWHVTHPGGDGLSLLVAGFGASFALAVAWLQRRTPKARRGPLWWSWRIGAVALAAAAVSLAVPRAGLLPGAFALGLALPLMVAGMALEIVAFLGWIQLHRSIGRGVQLPGVQRLMPARERGIAVAGQSVAGALVVVAAWHPGAWLARVAGASVCAAWLFVGAAFLNTNRRVRRFLADAVKPSR